MKVLVLSGGDSPEREVSIRSGEAVSKALISAGFVVLNYDPKDGDEGLVESVKKAEVVFPISHGLNGEDGVLQEKLEKLNVKFLGSSSTASENSFFKDKTHKILGDVGVIMPKYSIVSKTDIDHELFKNPFVLKPIDGGSSIDTLIAREVDESTIQEVLKLLETHSEMLLEEMISGQEITVSVLDNEALPIIAIIPPEGLEFDYENKYNGATQEICPVPYKLVTAEKQKEAQEISLKVHSILQARHLSRVDIIVTDSGDLYVLELNTIPGMTSQSLYPKSAKVAGYSPEQLVTKFVEMVTR